MGSGAQGVTRLSVESFRAFRTAHHFDIPLGLPIVLVGPNGAGKTTLLEALSFFSPGLGLRKASLRHIQSQGVEYPPWHVEAVFSHPLSGVFKGSVIWQGGEKRQVAFDDVPVGSLLELNETLRVMWVTPIWDRLLSESPGNRRMVLDRWVATHDGTYGPHLLRYGRALKERNLLLRALTYDPLWMEGLEQILALEGWTLTQKRDAFFRHLEDALRNQDIPLPKLTLQFRCGMPEAVTGAQDPVSAWKNALYQSREEDRRLKMTRYGAHRADWMAITEQGLWACHCSTGEQKLMVLSLVVAATQYIAGGAQERVPCVFLVDDVVAHLDARYRHAVTHYMAQLPAQVWFSGTDAQFFPLKEACVIEINKTYP